MAGAWRTHENSKATDGVVGDGGSALCARADRGGTRRDLTVLLRLHLQLTNGRRVELNLSDEQLPRALMLLEHPA